MELVVQLTQVERLYGQGEVAVRALDRVDFTLARGEFAAIVGPSGSGKSTLLNLIGGLDNPSSGEVALAGRAISDMSGRELADFRRDHIGFIFQAYNLIPVLSAAENVEYVLLLQGVPEMERRRRTLAMLRSVGLSGYAGRRPGALSGGQQQRVAVARAMVSKPDLILADEPTANLDTATGHALLELMRQLNRDEGMTFLFSTHDPKVMDNADRLVVLEDGRIKSDTRR